MEHFEYRGCVVDIFTAMKRQVDVGVYGEQSGRRSKQNRRFSRRMFGSERSKGTSAPPYR